MVNSIIILAIVVLPGWISISANQRYHARIVDRSTVMSWGILFYHAMIVHLIGVAIVAAVVFIRQDYFLGTLGLDRILTDGPADFTKESPGTAFSVFGCYSLWIVVGSTMSGIIDLPSKVTIGVGKVARILRLAPPPVSSNQPVWYRALNLDRQNKHKSNVQVRVYMKNSDIYVGDLESYPILPDSEESKDIRLGNSILYPRGDFDSGIELDFSNHVGGGVLLNTMNISSVQYMFHENYGLEDKDVADSGPYSRDHI